MCGLTLDRAWQVPQVAKEEQARLARRKRQVEKDGQELQHNDRPHAQSLARAGLRDLPRTQVSKYALMDSYRTQRVITTGVQSAGEHIPMH